MKRKPKLEKIFYLDAIYIPSDFYDICMDIDDEFPLHYSNGVVRVYDDGNKFSEWLKTIGFDFEGEERSLLAVQGT